MFQDPTISRIVDVIQEVGVQVRSGTVPDDAFLPGIRIDSGGLIVEEQKVAHAGDILHEAAHLALMTPDVREHHSGALPENPAEEMACHAWCYAAAKTFDIPLEVVFHDAYAAGGSTLREAFESGGTLGQPMLQFWMMTRLNDKDPFFDHLPTYPAMGRWLRDHRTSADG